MYSPIAQLYFRDQVVRQAIQTLQENEMLRHHVGKYQNTLISGNEKELELQAQVELAQIEKGNLEDLMNVMEREILSLRSKNDKYVNMINHLQMELSQLEKTEVDKLLDYCSYDEAKSINNTGIYSDNTTWFNKKRWCC